MTRMKFISAMALCCIALLSCTKEGTVADELTERQTPRESLLYLNISPLTKASGADHGIQSDDNIVAVLDVFVFRDDEGSGMLDVYRRFEGKELTSLSDLKIETTTGKKKIYAVANSHKESWKDVATIRDFEKEVAMLASENLRSFTMIGGTEATLELISTISLSIERLVARVVLNSVKTDFAGGPYEGSSLENVKAYLINVIGKTPYCGYGTLSSPLILNQKALVQTDAGSCLMTGMLYDQIAERVGDEGTDTPHYYYCYENMAESENSSIRFTRLVIQADLNGTTYYYPININRENFGYTPSNAHVGVKRNHTYTIDAVIKRPGSSDPDVIVEKGALDITTTILDWVLVPDVNIEF